MDCTMKNVSQILQEIRPEQDFAASCNFLADGLLDSFDIVCLVAALEKNFCICIQGKDILPKNFCNAQAIGALLIKYGVAS